MHSAKVLFYCTALSWNASGAELCWGSPVVCHEGQSHGWSKGAPRDAMVVLCHKQCFPSSDACEKCSARETFELMLKHRVYSMQQGMGCQLHAANSTMLQQQWWSASC
jgi:hypothetical protein